MALAGLKKKINKANQIMSEKIGTTKGSELDDDYLTMEKKIETMDKLLDDLIDKVLDLLNPGYGKMLMSSSKSISRLGGQSSKGAGGHAHSNPEATLGDSMITHGTQLGVDTPYGDALVEAGEAFKQLSELKFSLEDYLKQNFFEPIQHQQNKDLKEVNFHRKKVSSRRLDYDWQKRKQKEGGIEDVQMAEEKFIESKQIAESAMSNFIGNQAEHISQITALMEAQLEYHNKCADVLKKIVEEMKTKSKQSSNEEKSRIRMPISRSTDWSKNEQQYKLQSSNFKDSNGKVAVSKSTDLNKGNNDDWLLNMNDSPHIQENAPFNIPNIKTDICKAVAEYDFVGEDSSELSFFEGELIKICSRIDENWFEGFMDGRGQGRIPCNYVRIISGQVPK